MAFGRRSGFGVGAPKIITLLISVVLVALAVGSALTHYPHSLSVVVAHRFWFAVAGYVVLLLGVLLPGL